MLSCGEASGDLYAGALIRAMRNLVPGIEISGQGGPEFSRAGGQLLTDYRGLNVTGFAEIVTKLPQLREAKKRLVDAARMRRPGAFVVIDYFGFNARLAREVRALGIPVVYYVSPQVWAWRAGRIKTIREIANRMLVIFPFEAPIYREAGVPVEFVGHPLLDLVDGSASRGPFLSGHGLDPAAPTVALLPGSRRSELRRILPTLIEAAQLIATRVPRVQYVVARASGLDDSLFAPLRQLPGAVIVQGQTDAALSSADLAVTASGTATVQTALHGTPMVVVYRVSALEYRLVRPFIKLDTFAMVNLIAGARVVPELIQDAFTADAVAAEAIPLLTDPARAARMRGTLKDVAAKLGGAGASRRAAEAIVKVMGN